MFTQQRLTNYPRIFIVIYVLAMVFVLCTGEGYFDRFGNPIGGDFVTFFAASELVLAGEAEHVFNVQRLHQTEQAIVGNGVEPLAWHYPPHTLLIVSPLALFPYSLVLIAVTLLSVLLYGSVLFRIDTRQTVRTLGWAFPGFFFFHSSDRLGDF